MKARPSQQVQHSRRALTRRRKALGWSQNALARAAGKDPGFVSRVMSGKERAPGVLGDLSEALDKGERGELVPPSPPKMVRDIAR